ncbi:hypothetical protein PILCRDRAFT_726664 [Piloderma croceum F 1598]|uniref:Uncharacterized protein n=1 Tax=Piloderma croceum (strain F 1598) TaxID=765440 RepID=A0A0C3F009_PILCF|nr:hypothetical protein PILCRDRAFT_726664 [Piloderma croceum F 1598]
MPQASLLHDLRIPTISNVRPRKAAEPATSPFPFFWVAPSCIGAFFCVFYFFKLYYI